MRIEAGLQQIADMGRIPFFHSFQFPIENSSTYFSRNNKKFQKFSSFLQIYYPPIFPLQARIITLPNENTKTFLSWVKSEKCYT